MGKGQRFTEESRVDAVKQVTERGFAFKDVGKRLGVSPDSLYQWIKRYGVPTEEWLAKEAQAGRMVILPFLTEAHSRGQCNTDNFGSKIGRLQ
jgi:transposase-like protein